MFEDILHFWFTETSPPHWWKADPQFDAVIAAGYGASHAAALRGELFEWRQQPRGRLAEIIVLDQFSRNLFRGTAQAFAGDAMALALAQEAVAGLHDQALAPLERSILYMPYMHSESAAIHGHAERLFASLGMPESHRSEQDHKALVDRFGRYLHRNAALGRPSRSAELVLLVRPGSRF